MSHERLLNKFSNWDIADKYCLFWEFPKMDAVLF